MITEEQFHKAINDISDSYEKIKDHVFKSDLHLLGESAQGILGELSNLRDIACENLRQAFITKNFNDN